LLALTGLSAALTHPDQPSAAGIQRASALRLEHVSKSFRLPHRRYSTLKERALHPFRTRTFDELRAVDDVTLDVAPGEFFGIVGRNGSGKSTLLKCLAGIYRTDRGHIGVNGRLAPFIELGVGFNPDLNARDNVVLNAIMMGLPRSEAKARFDDIIAFAELEQFVDLPLKNYSSGMHVRLAFSVAIEVDAEILLIDEVLAVGDAAFQQKCFDKFEQLKRDGRTIVFVTHDMAAVQRFCHRAMLMDHGSVLQIGDPHAISLAYNELNFGRLVAGAPMGAGRYGDHTIAEIDDAWFESDEGERVNTLPQGAPCTMCMQVRFHVDVDEPIFAFYLRNEPRHTVFETASNWRADSVGRFAAGDTAHVRVRFDNWLTAQRYTLTPSVARAGQGADVIDLREDLVALRVAGTRTTGGLVDIPHTFDVDRS
jgi:ABC-type polysaccharide/polyol phosphate transport system ATPase subunit